MLRNVPKDHVDGDPGVPHVIAIGLGFFDHDRHGASPQRDDRNVPDILVVNRLAPRWSRAQMRPVACTPAQSARRLLPSNCLDRGR